MLVTAREAFVAGMEISSAIAAVVAVGLAILALSMLRHVRSGSESESSPDVDRADEPGAICQSVLSPAALTEA